MQYKTEMFEAFIPLCTMSMYCNYDFDTVKKLLLSPVKQYVKSELVVQNGETRKFEIPQRLLSESEFGWLQQIVSDS
jgi:hypothetical protein